MLFFFLCSLSLPACPALQNTPSVNVCGRGTMYDVKILHKSEYIAPVFGNSTILKPYYYFLNTLLSSENHSAGYFSASPFRVVSPYPCFGIGDRSAFTTGTFLPSPSLGLMASLSKCPFPEHGIDFKEFSRYHVLFYKVPEKFPGTLDFLHPLLPHLEALITDRLGV